MRMIDPTNPPDK